MTTPFSVLMAVYEKDDPDNFRRALCSVSSDQTLRPDQIVIVRDGPVGPGLTAVLDEVRNGMAVDHVPAAVVELPTNRGLALALEAGLKTCAHDVIARADADDISLPQRFAMMLPVFEERRLDLLGAAITEFAHDETQVGITRTLPTEPDVIARTARFRDPFNHPTVIYRRRAVVAAGGYQHLNKMEDYWLFVRMIQNGARVANLAEPLVLYRVGAGAYQRRGGTAMLRSELALQWLMLRAGFTSPLDTVRNLATRGVYRLIPAPVRQRLYRQFIVRDKG